MSPETKPRWTFYTQASASDINSDCSQCPQEAGGFPGLLDYCARAQCMRGLFFGFFLMIFAIEIAAGRWDIPTKMRTSPSRTLTVIPSALDRCGVAGGVEQFIRPQKDFLSSILVKSCSEAIKEVFDNKSHIIRAWDHCGGNIWHSLQYDPVLCYPQEHREDLESALLAVTSVTSS
ncbi:hypothetical protein GH733_015156 [Mirounga leonina]|nr:hypothetical protein GH733_015156 [Mirounga leonina]